MAKKATVDPPEAPADELELQLQSINAALPDGWEIYAYQDSAEMILENSALKITHTYSNRDAMANDNIMERIAALTREAQSKPGKGSAAIPFASYENGCLVNDGRNARADGALNSEGVRRLLMGEIQAKPENIIRAFGLFSDTIDKRLDRYLQVNALFTLMEIKDLLKK